MNRKLLKVIGGREGTRDGEEGGGWEREREREGKKAELKAKWSHITPPPRCGVHHTHAHNNIIRVGTRQPRTAIFGLVWAHQQDISCV